MKNLLLAAITFTTVISVVTVFEISCKKQTNSQTVLTKQQILVQKTWRVDRLHHVISGVYSSYTSGGSNTTGLNYDNLRFTFNSNGTGSLVDLSGNTVTTTWQFTTSDDRTLMLTVNNSTPTINTWEMVEIAGNYLHASVHLTISGNPNNIETFRLIQIP